MSNSLMTASIGLLQNSEGDFFLQIITADQQNHYFVEITEEQAKHLAFNEVMEIEGVDDDPKMLLGRSIH